MRGQKLNPTYHVERHKQILLFLEEYIEREDYAPSQVEMGDHFNISNVRISYLLKQMRELGLITYTRSIRSLDITKKGTAFLNKHRDKLTQ